MNRCPWLYRSAGLVMSLSLAPLALADVPGAMDRVPADAPIVVSMKNMGQFYGSLTSMAKTLKLPMDAMSGLDKGAQMLKTDGLNSDGAAALAVMSLDDKGDDDKGPIVMVVPVKDYAAFAKALGGSGSGLDSVKLENEPAFVKDIGGGYAAIGPVKDVVDKFAGKAGSGKSFETLMGPTGRAIAESDDAFVVANMDQCRDKLKQAFEGAKSQMEMMGAMAGGGANAATFEAMGKAMDGFARDGQAGVVGLKATDAGVKLDFGAQFKEGSEFANYFQSKGKASTLTASLPNPKEGFLFATAMDTSSPGIRQLFKGALDAMRKDPETAKALSGINPFDQIEKMDGAAFCMGTSPALMGGVFLNTCAYIKTSDPAGYLKSMKEAMTNINGKNLQGMTYTTAYESGGGKVGETSVDTWSMKFQVDQSNPAAQQIAQMQMMFFGPTGMNGYIAPAKDGVVVTYAKNSDLMTRALDAAKNGHGLSEDAGVKTVAANLPADRSVEIYIGIRSILETAQGFMGMMGGGGANFNVPADLPPVGIGGTTDSGGMRASVYVPTQVITTIKAFGDSMKGEDAADEGDEKDAPKKKEKTGQPKF